MLWKGRLRKVRNSIILCSVRAVGKDKEEGREGGGKGEEKEGLGCWRDLRETLV